MLLLCWWFWLAFHCATKLCDLLCRNLKTGWVVLISVVYCMLSPTHSKLKGKKRKKKQTKKTKLKDSPPATLVLATRVNTVKLRWQPTVYHNC